MSQSGSQAAAFFRDVRATRLVWLVRDDDGSPTHLSAEDGTRSRDGLVIGINWSGPRLVGWILTPTEVLNRLTAAN